MLIVIVHQRYALLCFFNHLTAVTSLGVSHRYTLYFVWVRGRVRDSSIHCEKHKNVEVEVRQQFFFDLLRLLLALRRCIP